MKKIFISISLYFPLLLIAQTGYRAVYEYAGYHPKDSVLLSLYKRDILYGSLSGHARFNVVFNDSLAYQFNGSKRKDKNNIYGRKSRHHDVFYIKASGKKISYIKHPHPKPWLVESIESYKKFIVLQDNVISGKYNCSRGYFMDKADTVFALISKDIQHPYGPFGFVGLPGLVVEIFYRK